MKRWSSDLKTWTEVGGVVGIVVVVVSDAFSELSGQPLLAFLTQLEVTKTNISFLPNTTHHLDLVTGRAHYVVTVARLNYVKSLI